MANPQSAGNVHRKLSPHLCLAFAFLLLSCAKPAASPFLGHWQNNRVATDSFSIIPNGDGLLLVAANRKNYFTGQPEDFKAPASVKDGALHVTTATGATQVFAHVEATDTLVTQGLVGQQVEYRRVPPPPSTNAKP